MHEMNNGEMGEHMHKEEECESCRGGKCGGKWMMMRHHGCKPGSLYGVAALGALVYYIQTAPTFWMGALGVVKALIWPAMLIYKAFTILGM